MRSAEVIENARIVQKSAGGLSDPEMSAPADCYAWKPLPVDNTSLVTALDLKARKKPSAAIDSTPCPVISKTMGFEQDSMQVAYIIPRYTHGERFRSDWRTGSSHCSLIRNSGIGYTSSGYRSFEYRSFEWLSQK